MIPQKKIKVLLSGEEGRDADQLESTRRLLCYAVKKGTSEEVGGRLILPQGGWGIMETYAVGLKYM